MKLNHFSALFYLFYFFRLRNRLKYHFLLKYHQGVHLKSSFLKTKHKKTTHYNAIRIIIFDVFFVISF